MADIGILTALLLDSGSQVIGVEQNPAMRKAAEEILAAHPHFVSMEGSAEVTGLDDDYVDAVTAAQAFHRFRADETAREFRRILRPGGWIALIWNSRQKRPPESGHARLAGSPVRGARRGRDRADGVRHQRLLQQAGNQLVW